MPREVGVGSGDTECSVIEKCDVAVRMGHGRQPRQHPLRKASPRRQPCAQLGRKQRAKLDQVQNVFEDDVVIHGAAYFEMRAVAQDLLGKLCVEQPKPRLQPAFRFGGGKETAEHEGLGVGEQVIAQQMKFERRGKRPRLRRASNMPSIFGPPQ